VPEVDLHGLHPEQAVKRLEMALHTARIQGSERLTVITGRGLGNAKQTPVLRKRVEAWLAAEGGRYGATRWQPISRGGALDVRFGGRAPEPPPS
jgi:DNA-nicking Smr family endonuclease